MIDSSPIGDTDKTQPIVQHTYYPWSRINSVNLKLHKFVAELKGPSIKATLGPINQEVNLNSRNISADAGSSEVKSVAALLPNRTRSSSWLCLAWLGPTNNCLVSPTQ